MAAAVNGAGASDVAFVLIHSPLVGPTTWMLVAEELRRRGRSVVLPHLDNPDQVAVPYQRHHAEQVRRAVEAEAAGASVLLVAHSGAGPVLPLAGETLVNPVAGYVFVDAPLPAEGVNRLASAPPPFAERLRHLESGGRVPRWAEWWNEDILTDLIPDEDVRRRFLSELEPLPTAFFEERLRVPPEWPDAPCAYLRLSRIYDDDAAAAAARGWEVGTMRGDLLHMLVEPAPVADALEEMAERLAAREAPHDGGPGGAGDPVLVQRRRMASLADAARRIGFAALALAIALFAVALYWDLPPVLVALVIACLAVATVTLLPAIVVGYGVAAADREDRDRGHGRDRGERRRS